MSTTERKDFERTSPKHPFNNTAEEESISRDDSRTSE